MDIFNTLYIMWYVHIEDFHNPSLYATEHSADINWLQNKMENHSFFIWIQSNWIKESKLWVSGKKKQIGSECLFQRGGK